MMGSRGCRSWRVQSRSFWQNAWSLQVISAMALKENRPVVAFICEFESCCRSYDSRNSLLRHYRENLSHRPVNLQRKKDPTSQDVVSGVFPETLAQRKRWSRAKQSVVILTDEELIKFSLPRLTKIVNEWEYKRKCCQNSRVSLERPRAADVLKRFQDLQQKLCFEYPELVPWVYTTLSTPAQPTPEVSWN